MEIDPAKIKMKPFLILSVLMDGGSYVYRSRKTEMNR